MAGEEVQLQPKLDQEIAEFLKSAPESAWSAPPLEMRMGLSTRIPFTGLTKTHAGTKPALSVLLSTLEESREGLNKENEERELRELSRTARHQPSSNDCRTRRCSPTRERVSSSGSTGWKSCRTVRFWKEDDDELEESREFKPGAEGNRKDLGDWEDDAWLCRGCAGLRPDSARGRGAGERDAEIT